MRRTLTAAVPAVFLALAAVAVFVAPAAAQTAELKLAYPIAGSKDPDRGSATLGTKFTVATAGKVVGVEFFRVDAENKATTVQLWGVGTTPLATAGGVPSSTGRVRANFAAPIPVAPGTTYIASYFAPSGRYTHRLHGFDRARTAGDLAAPASAGVYRYGTSAAKPGSLYQNEDYYVTPVFVADPLAPAALAAPTTDAAAPPATPTADPTRTATSTTTPPPATPHATPPTTPASEDLPPDALHATPATFASVFSGAPGGSTILLASGDYGTFTGANKASTVTLKPEPGAAPALAVAFNGANNLTLDGLTVRRGSMVGATKNITVKNSTFTGALKIDGVANSGIVLDRNTHNNLFLPTNCTGSPARVHLAYNSATPSGVTIRNSTFDGGNMDGVQSGVGVTIENNTFRNIRERSDTDCAHSDSIQLIDAPGSVVRGNYLKDNATGIVAFDGIRGALIERNVVDIGRSWGIELYSDTNSVVRHNTVVYRGPGCYSNSTCGTIQVNHKSADPAGVGTVVVDNIATSADAVNSSQIAQRHHNLVRDTPEAGDTFGVPAYVGGATPADYAGYRLAPGSPGAGRASDGTDAGI